MKDISIEAQYEQYYGIHLNHYSDTWGGKTYNKMLTKEYPSEDLQSTASTQISEVTFLYPKLVGNPTYVDGIAEGHFTIYNSNSGASVTVTAYTVSLKKTDDVASNETILGAVTTNISTDNIILKSGTYTDHINGTGGDLLVVPFYIPLSHQKIDYSERILLTLKFTSTGGTPWIGHYNGGDPDDIKIKIPYSPGG